ncbi:hypothetical protein B0H63DRAFT_283400 [Podospora didyma]|uniref:Uncharacterized protein n=1 Tax=Podospora didyma TaxID=330526 RepID=A0AAE0N6H1_9PEZI|nr:hypothetical protein B0H63DRAFT_283400 [Podospora didyma]
MAPTNVVLGEHEDNRAWDLTPVTGSLPVDLSKPYSTASIAGKTILITGGASGFGAAFARHWAAHGAHTIIGDLNDKAGEELAAELRQLPGSSGHHYYQHCDVTCWEDQVALFKLGASATPTKSIQAVVAGAGITNYSSGQSGVFESPRGLDADSPPPPPLKVIGVNLTGVMYTTHLALFWLPRSSGAQKDRHLLLVSSIAGVAPLPGLTEYNTSKHAVMGLFRALRGTVWQRGMRVNVICPYFVATPLIPASGLAILAGGELGEVPDVVDAATRLMADESICGRGLVIGPKMSVVKGDGTGNFGGDLPEVDQKASSDPRDRAIWEIYAHDYDKVELFVWRYVTMLNRIRMIRGAVGICKDLWRIYITGGPARPQAQAQR